MSTGRQKIAIIRGSEDTPLTRLLLTQTAKLQLSLREIATAAGWRNTSTTAAMLKGKMRIPFNKLEPLAKCLEIDPITLLKTAYPEHFKILQNIFKTYPISENEKNFVELLRETANGYDVCPTTPNEVTEFKTLVRKMIEKTEQEATPDLERRDRIRQRAGFDSILEQK